MGMFGLLAGAALAIGVKRYFFSSSQVEVNNTSSSSNPSQKSDYYRTSSYYNVRSTNEVFRSNRNDLDTNLVNSRSSSSPSQGSDHSGTPTSNEVVRNHNDLDTNLVNSRSSSNPSQGSDHYRTSSYNAPNSNEVIRNRIDLDTNLVDHRSSSSSSLSSSSSSSSLLPQTLKPVATNERGKAKYELVENNSTLPLYITPEDFKDLIKKGIVPEILKKTLSPSRYKDYFSALLYAEDYYYEKWCDYELRNVTLELHEAAVYKKSDHRNKKIIVKEEKDDKTFVAFKMDDIPEKRPFLLSRDLVYARPSESNIQAFQGIIHRVVKSNIVLVEFNDKFHSQHHPTKRYDISFSFNRVCLKRAHEALNSISDSLLENFLFPNSLTRKTTTTITTTTTTTTSATTIQRITAVQSSPPYLISGPRCASESKSAAHLRQPSRTGAIIQESVVQIYRTSPNCRILICSPSNSACDVLMRALKRSIPDSAMFRANAAFRERDDVPEDILSSCLIKEECFACPPIHKLRGFKVIFSTFVSCFRLHNVGLRVGHFSHIFMVDASSAIEPEALVVLANFAGENTAVIVAGEAGSSPSWVRSEIGRMNGLKVSYFERLKKFRPYLGLNPEFISQLDY